MLHNFASSPSTVYLLSCLTTLEFSSVVVDIISAIGFDKTGDNLAIGDRGGRVIIFERNDGKDVRILAF